MTRGGKRVSSGRPALPEDQRKKRFTVRLKPKWISWLKDRNASATVEKALEMFRDQNQE